MNEDVRVLTMWQPWASLLAHKFKLNETRPKNTSFRGTYLIHAACRFDKFQKRICYEEPFFSALKSVGLMYDFKTKRGEIIWYPFLPKGQIIGAFQVDKCIEVSINSPFINASFLYDGQTIQGNEYKFGDYRVGRSVWIGKNHRLLEFPIDYKNGQGYYLKYKGDLNQLNFK